MDAKPGDLIQDPNGYGWLYFLLKYNHVRCCWDAFELRTKKRYYIYFRDGIFSHAIMARIGSTHLEDGYVYAPYIPLISNCNARNCTFVDPIANYKRSQI